MPALSFASYDATLARVRLNLAALRTALGADATAVIERSTDQIRWYTVRGGGGVAVTASAADLDDYEFAPDVPSYYRARVTGVSWTLEAGLDSWVANANCTVAASTAQAHGGTHSMALTSAAAGDMKASARPRAR